MIRKPAEYTLTTLIAIVIFYIGFKLLHLVLLIITAPIEFLINMLNESTVTVIINILSTIILLALIILAFVLIVRFERFLVRKRFNIYLLQLTNLIILLGIVYSLFTPYFYTDNYLKSTGKDLLELEYALHEEGLSYEEIVEIAKETRVMGEAFASSNQEIPEKTLSSVETENVKRSFGDYIYRVSVIEKEDNESKKTYEYTITRDKWRFLISGIKPID